MNLNNFLYFNILIFFIILFFILFYFSFHMFFYSYGKNHRLSGLILLFYLLFGYLQVYYNYYYYFKDYFYDLILSFLCILTTLTAAFDFKKAHSHIKNIASGTLEKEATVTFNEMIEHSFYQILNLFQISFIHLLPFMTSYSLTYRLLFAYISSSFWFFRSFFPVNKFSDNYNKGQDVFSLISILYRTKKYQYMFYKHFLLHSLTITLAATSNNNNIIPNFLIIGTPAFITFRLYWLCLNTSYVMEFFLQTLVKKNYMSQSTLIKLQLILMLVSTIVAVQVLVAHCDFKLGLLSLILNLVNRKREMMNIAIVTIVAYFLYKS